MAGALILRTSDFLDKLGLGMGEAKAICSAHESFFGRPGGLEVDRKEELHEELQEESLRRTFVGFTQAA